jgi:hypothetical protein
MVGPNVLIEDEDNVLLVDYAKKIGLVMKGIRVSIREKQHCKNNYNVEKIVLDGLLNIVCHANIVF